MDVSLTAHWNTTRLIVVGLDGSDDAERALRWAVHLGRPTRSLIQVVAVCAPDPAATAAARGIIDEAVARILAGTPGAAIVGDVHHGDPAAVLVAAAHHATMLVLGSNGRTDHRRAAVGSVAETCTRIARCPVVVVPGRSRVASPHLGSDIPGRASVAV